MIEEIKQGNQSAFKKLLEKYYDSLYRFAYLRIQDRDLALDLLQETCFKFYKNINNFDSTRPVLPYLLQIIKNLHHNYKYRYAQKMVKLEEFFVKPVQATVEESIIKKEEQSLILKALQSLSDKDQLLLILREFENYTYEELASVFNVSVGTIMSRLHYARKKLKEAFTGVTNEKV
ncbi:MAG: sigma-70 family RNA polymerase sigma factor [Calditrichia bacterium]